jgi:hypothetical protein
MFSKTGTGFIRHLFAFTLIILLCSPGALFGQKKGQYMMMGKKPSGIRGMVVLKSDGQPVEKAYIYAYVGKIESRAAQLGIIGITDWISHGSGANGTYELDLPPGEYYLAARKRANGLNYGPIVQGDLYDHSLARKAVVIRKGRYKKINFELIDLDEPMFFQGLTAVAKVSDTGIKGKILDESGDHIPGTFAMAYKDDDMQRVPDFASTLTDDEGNYTLYLPTGGRYWLAARFYAMKKPQPNEPFARYEGSKDYSVVVEKGQFLEGIDMVLKPYDGEAPDDVKLPH